MLLNRRLQQWRHNARRRRSKNPFDLALGIFIARTKCAKSKIKSQYLMLIIIHTRDTSLIICQYKFFRRTWDYFLSMNMNIYTYAEPKALSTFVCNYHWNVIFTHFHISSRSIQNKNITKLCHTHNTHIGFYCCGTPRFYDLNLEL